MGLFACLGLGPRIPRQTGRDVMTRQLAGAAAGWMGWRGWRGCSLQSVVWRLESGVFGIWRLELGVSGVWNLEAAGWSLESGFAGRLKSE